MIGKIIKQISNDYTVKIDNETIICKPRGKFRNFIKDVLKTLLFNHGLIVYEWSSETI